MTRTKRWGLLATSLAVAAGTGYGGYTQRHLILGEAAATADAGEAEAAQGETAGDAVQPIRVTPGEGEDASPRGYQNPLRQGFGEARVVRGNDETDAPPAHERFEPPPLRAGPSRFGGSAVATVEVEDEGDHSPAPLDPPPAFSTTPPEASGIPEQAATAYAPNRFAPPQNNFAPAPAAAADGSAPSGSRFGGSSFPSEYPTPSGAGEPSAALPSTPPTGENAVAPAASEPFAPPAPQRVPTGGETAAGAVGTGIDTARLQPSAPDPLGAAGALTAGGKIEGAGQPGARELDGAQSPSIVLEKFAPPEIQIGKPAKFDIKVKNVGQVTAENVVITDQVPQGTRLIDTTPQAASTTAGNVVWQLGTLQAGEEKSVAMQLMPVGEGEIGSVATVTFSAQASVRTKATRPQLFVETTAPRQVLIGQEVKLSIRLSNPGTGAATRVVLEEDVPAGLSHAGGQALEFEVGTLKPGETRELELTLSATGAGVAQNVLRARAEANLSVESHTAIEVISPDLAIKIDGPSKRYLERQATHELIISNPGTAPAQNIEMVAHLPKGLKFVSTNNQGQYDTTSHAVVWSLEQLGPQGQGTVALTTMPMESGQQKIRVESKADMNLATAQEHVVDVEGLAALFFEVADAADPIEVGGETIYEVRVINQGTKTSTNVRVAAALPASLKPLEAGGATSGVITGQQIVFEALPRLAPKADALFRIRVQGLAKGNQQVRVQLASDEIPGGVTKEESTRVYADE